MQKTNKKFILFILLVILSLVISVKAQSEQELLLKRRVDLFYKYFTDGKIDKMSELASKKNRQENSDDKNSKKYRIFLKQLSSQKPRICTKILKIENNRAVVAVETSFWIKERQEWLSNTDNNVWIFVDNNWFFESQIER